MAIELKLGMLVAEKYRLERPLGEGAYGAVWRGTQRGLSRTVAIKFLKRQANDHGADRRFEREAQMLAALDHPGCVKMYDFGEHDGTPFLVTEFVDGETMHQWLRDEHSVVEVLDVTWQLLDALAYAHAHNIIHRDLKPSNVVIGQPLQGGVAVKVLDFGISRMAGDKRGDITKTGELIGTPGFMSPEQLTGSDALTPASDLYAVGVILYHALEGKAPFTGRTPIEGALKHLTHVAARIAREDVPEQLRDIVAKLLEKEPADRYQNARVVQQALRLVPTSAPAEVAEEPPDSADTEQQAIPPALVAPETPRHAPVKHVTPQPAPASVLPESPAPARVEPPQTDRLAAPVVPMWVYGVIVTLLAVIAALLVVIVVLFVNRDDAAPTSPDLIQTALRRAPTTSAVPTEPTSDAPALAAAQPESATAPPGCGLDPFEPGLQQLRLTTITSDDRVDLYIPAGYDPDVQHPLLLVIHDTLQAPHDIFVRLKLQEFADRDGVVIVLPHDDTLVRAWLSDSAQARLEREVALALDSVCVDRDRVYSFGIGSGGHATHAHACSTKAVAATATLAYRLSEDETPCEHPYPTLLLAPLSDGRDPVDGGQGCLAEFSTPVRALDDHENIYRDHHQCDAAATVTLQVKKNRCQTWGCEVTFESCHLDGGRTLPGFDSNFACDGAAADFPYVTKIWDFFGLKTTE